MPTLVVVESPNKIAKIQKCLGPAYSVVATVGHFRDLPQTELGVDVTSWTPTYVALPGKEGVVNKLRDALKRADGVLLATDADREGEAIAWHVAQTLRLTSPRRIRFQELTPAALKAAVAKAGPLDVHLVDAQQARRVLDRLVGYQVSPLLQPFGSGHSAGRVQSAALHLVVEREKAREAFRPQDFWTVTAHYGAFRAVAAEQDEKGVWASARYRSAHDAASAVAAAKACAQHRVAALEVKQAQRAPKPPFTTATLQQAASAQLGFKPADTMALAQQLFELGAISYHRTDSVALSAEAVQMARDFIAREYPEALPSTPVVYRNQDAAQEAHEAIRPTALRLVDVSLDERQEQLFGLISRRFLACQCRPAGLEKTVARLVAGGVSFLARGSVVRFPSFLRFSGADDEETVAAKHEGLDEGDDETTLPPLRVDELVNVRDVVVKADKTKPPPRFTQATLVRELQRTGIGRPSTYSATVEVLFARRYLEEEKKAVFPSPRGRLIDGALATAFPDVVAADYTASMERQLDEVASGKRRWKDTLTGWYAKFSAQMERADGVLQQFAKAHSALVDAAGDAPKPTGKPCPSCGKELLLKVGRHGAFLSCSGFPRCEYRADPSSRPSTQRCPKCNGPMTEQNGKFGRYARCDNRACEGRVDAAATTTEACPRCKKPLRDKGTFLGCSDYPRCSFTVDVKALERAKKSGTKCSKCSSLMVERKGAKGVFLSCLRYPACKETADVQSRAPAKSPRKAAGRG